MALTEEQNDELEEMLNCCMNHLDKLNEWEVTFIKDNYERWQKYGNRILLSNRQWEIIVKLNQKVQE